ncbi:hypothetical protein CsatB_015842 [Cannabis sativa]
MHVLAYCPIAAQCWERVAITTPTQQENCFLDWCVSVFNNANTETCRMFCILCWAIWGARNDKVWNNKDSTASFIYAFAATYLEQWNSTQAPYLETSRTGLLAGDGNDRWCAPAANVIKVNVDASIFEGRQDYGYGMVARDEHGFMLEATSRLCHGSVRPELAEVTLETDCLVVVQAICNPTLMTSLFGDVIKECQNLLVNLCGVTISFVKRSANLVAHEIARAVISYSDRIFSMGNVSTDLLPFLVAEFEV